VLGRDVVVVGVAFYAGDAACSREQQQPAEGFGGVSLHGIYTVGRLTAVSPATVQSLFGGRTGRTTSDQAPGIDPRPVVPRALPSCASARRTFDHHTLDGATVRATLLDLIVRPGRPLRRRGQAARALTLTLRFAGGTSWDKTRRLTEPSAHDGDLRTAAYQLMEPPACSAAASPGSP
jgi:DNA polymerase-4